MKLKIYNTQNNITFGAWEVTSGFLGGQPRGGQYIVQLEEEWAKKFGSKHAIACNSATSGLMAAVKAASTKLRKEKMLVSVPAFTMSATAAAPAILGHALYFEDCEDETFCNRELGVGDVTIATNLFGHPAPLQKMRARADANRRILIEDNAQAILAQENEKFTGTIGHIGVFSLNVHKHIQAGEGGVCVTDDDALATYMRMFINHAEMFPDSHMIGLNLRMTELTAFVALQQLREVERLLLGRQLIASDIIASIGDIPGLKPLTVRDGCVHVAYALPFLVEKNRKEFVEAVRLEGVPLVEGYVNPLNRMGAFSKWKASCPVAEDLHDRRLFYWENCAWDPTTKQIRDIGKAFRNAAEKVELI
jgi:dTDP-4-amino-4,6-dideoxygalactose transaminase